MLSIPTIGIGSGPHCDSQVLVLHDILGMYPHSPSFAKRYAEIGQLATQALESLRRRSPRPHLSPLRTLRAHQLALCGAIVDGMLETNDWSDPLVIALRAFDASFLRPTKAPSASSRRRIARSSSTSARPVAK